MPLHALPTLGAYALLLHALPSFALSITYCKNVDFQGQCTSLDLFGKAVGFCHNFYDSYNDV
jgi:hypothetical protein